MRSLCRDKNYRDLKCVTFGIRRLCQTESDNLPGDYDDDDDDDDDDGGQSCPWEVDPGRHADEWPRRVRSDWPQRLSHITNLKLDGTPKCMGLV